MQLLQEVELLLPCSLFVLLLEYGSITLNTYIYLCHLFQSIFSCTVVFLKFFILYIPVSFFSILIWIGHLSRTISMLSVSHPSLKPCVFLVPAQRVLCSQTKHVSSYIPCQLPFQTLYLFQQDCNLVPLLSHSLSDLFHPLPTRLVPNLSCVQS